MKKKEIEKNFKELEQKYKQLEKKSNFWFSWLESNMIDKPMVRTGNFPTWCITSASAYIDFYYMGEVKEILTNYNLKDTKVYAYCTDFFILKNYLNEYFLVNMRQATVTAVPKDLFSAILSELEICIEGQAFKIYENNTSTTVRKSHND